jgi:tRNA A37 N6-isopentenylltransferase MiaA
MNYSDFIEEVKAVLDYTNMTGAIKIDESNLNKEVDKRCSEMVNNGLVGDVGAINDEEEFDDGDVDTAVDILETELGG